jgi:hypothetical protein
VHLSLRWGYVAAGWSAVFAALHLFWGLGGSVGLAESAGRDLATRRPTWFVVLGLFGVAALLVTAAVLGALLARRAWDGWRRRVLLTVGGCVAAVLVSRAVAVELLLLTDALPPGAVSASERQWTLALWNPWFLIGGLASAAATLAAQQSEAVA